MTQTLSLIPESKMRGGELEDLLASFQHTLDNARAGNDVNGAYILATMGMRTLAAKYNIQNPETKSRATSWDAEKEFDDTTWLNNRVKFLYDNFSIMNKNPISEKQKEIYDIGEKIIAAYNSYAIARKL